MDVVHIQRFVAAAEHKHFGRAAAHLNVTQPSLTRSIQILEGALDVKLFDRGPRGVELTIFGEALLPHARSLINDRERAVGAIQEIKGLGQGKIRIAAARSFVEGVLPAAIIRILETSPHVIISVVEAHMRFALDKLREGEFDLCFGLFAHWVDQTGIEFQPLRKQTLSVIGRAEHPLAGRQDNSLEELSNYNWIIPDEDELVLRWRHNFEKDGLPVPNAPIRTSSYTLLKSSLLLGDFVTIMEGYSSRDDIESGRLVILRRIADDASDTSLPAGVFFSSERTMAPAAVALIAAVRKCL